MGIFMLIFFSLFVFFFNFLLGFCCICPSIHRWRSRARRQCPAYILGAVLGGRGGALENGGLCSYVHVYSSFF